jgi:hypothetical protein
MEEQNVIVGEFENQLYAEIAQRELLEAGIKARILKDNSDTFVVFSDQSEGVLLVIPGVQIEEARKVLEVKFI